MQILSVLACERNIRQGLIGMYDSSYELLNGNSREISILLQ